MLLSNNLHMAACDVPAIKRAYIEARCLAAVTALQKNNFHAYFAKDRTEAAAKLLELIPSYSLIGVGDSHTLYALDVASALNAKYCKVISPLEAMNVHGFESTAFAYAKPESREYAKQILAQYLTSDVFLLGANAITMDGQIVNMDATGNRIAGSLYGADRVILLAGYNKLVLDEEAARERIRSVAAPMDNLKYGHACAAVVTGKCTNCSSPRRVCNVTAILHKAPILSDFHVILIGEELGF